MKTAYKIGMAVVVISIMLGTAAGLLVQETHPADQVFTFRAKGFSLPSSTGCPNIPHNFTTWLQILVLGNRTNMNFVSTEVFSQGQAQLNLALNQTEYVYYNPINGTVERIDVPLAAYFNAGDSVDVSVNYFISGYTPATFTIGTTLIASSGFSC
ncbi:MAG: hypothetical protein ACREBQ_07085 [Nitrososphaerales archaeon]